MRRRFGLRRSVGLLVLAAAAAVAMTLFAGGAGAVVAGAGFTTDDPGFLTYGACTNGPAHTTPGVNCNLYASKDDVWINGGPSNGANSLTDGTYFFAVVAPSGQQDPNDGSSTLLSSDAYTEREFTVSGGKIGSYLGSTHVTDNQYSGTLGLLINAMPYNDTPNPGGVYIMALCQIDPSTYNPSTAPVAPSSCKYDAFKAPSLTCDPNVSDCTPNTFGVVSGEKYYDANMNGQLDPLEVGIANWAIDYTDGLSGTIYTGSDGTFSDSFVADSYTFTEEQATNTTGPPFNLPEWIQTGNTVDQTQNTGLDTSLLSNFIYSIGVFDGGTTSGVNFGNVCLGAGGGLTLGFWSNKNGQKLVTSSDLALLTSLNLIQPKTSLPHWQAFDPATKSQVATWLLNANATNMAYMLSAQLAAMELNVAHGFVDGGATVWVGGSINAFMTINDLMTAANTELGLAPYTVGASADRTLEETYKSALDAGNNNVNFVQSSPSGCPAPTFP